MTSVRLFKIDKSLYLTLTENEKKVLPFLIKATKLVDKIFLLQENKLNNGANFYPRDAIKDEINEAGMRNSKIFSPYTIIKRNKKGLLATVSYHKEYQVYLKPISDILSKAAKTSSNPTFKEYLNEASKCLLNGDYESIDKAWLKIKNSNVYFSIGPYERYLDKLFFLKRSYQASVGIIAKKETTSATEIRNILYDTFNHKDQSIMPQHNIEMQVINCIASSGLLSRLFFTREYLPSDSATTQKYGAKVLIYISPIYYKFNKLVYPIFKSVFDKKFRARYSRDILLKGNYNYILLNALVQQIHRYFHSRRRLKEYFPIFDEANNSVSGIQHAKYLVLKGVLDQKDLESIIINQICWIFSEWIIAKKSSLREGYLKGDTLIYNFLKREGAIHEKDGISWPNFAKMFFEMENLASIFAGILEKGTYEEARDFVNNYLNLDSLGDFDSRLLSIKPI